MVSQFVETTIFTRRWHELGLTATDLFELQIRLINNPTAGDLIVGTGGARKIRFALQHKGKRGGARIIYVDVLHDEQIHLLLCYTKAKKETLTDDQKKQLKAIIKAIKEEGRDG